MQARNDLPDNARSSRTAAGVSGFFNGHSLEIAENDVAPKVKKSFSTSLLF
ncbi:hypothetical protein [Methylosarcina fibrata]|uniref:hypothetical protein n=1 Tax=Methylosarcina fibrata TaxID=105972 RepID=UPI0003A9255F|nr:hypothetical protein [Methylosarcina fibrata]